MLVGRVGRGHAGLEGRGPHLVERGCAELREVVLN